MSLIHELYGAWEALRRLGFKADDLFVEVRQGHACMTLHLDQDTSEEKTFRIVCGDLGGMSQTMLFELWKKWAEDVGSGKIEDAELLRVYSNSAARRDGIPLVARLIERGLFKPGMTDGDERRGVPGDVHGRGGSDRASDDG